MVFSVVAKQNTDMHRLAKRSCLFIVILLEIKSNDTNNNIAWSVLLMYIQVEIRLHTNNNIA